MADQPQQPEASSVDGGGRARRERANASAYHGVYRDRIKGEWCARTVFRFATTELGFFDTEEAAARGYDREARRLNARHKLGPGSRDAPLPLNFPALSEEELAVDEGHGDSCGVCGEGGELLCCETCPAVAHHGCAGLDRVPSGDWYCHVCAISRKARASSCPHCSEAGIRSVREMRAHLQKRCKELKAEKEAAAAEAAAAAAAAAAGAVAEPGSAGGSAASAGTNGASATGKKRRASNEHSAGAKRKRAGSTAAASATVPASAQVGDSDSDSGGSSDSDSESPAAPAAPVTATKGRKRPRAQSVAAASGAGGDSEPDSDAGSTGESESEGPPSARAGGKQPSGRKSGASAGSGRGGGRGGSRRGRRLSMAGGALGAPGTSLAAHRSSSFSEGAAAAETVDEPVSLLDLFCASLASRTAAASSPSVLQADPALGSAPQPASYPSDPALALGASPDEVLAAARSLLASLPSLPAAPSNRGRGASLSLAQSRKAGAEAGGGLQGGIRRSAGAKAALAVLPTQFRGVVARAGAFYAHATLPAVNPASGALEWKPTRAGRYATPEDAAAAYDTVVSACYAACGLPPTLAHAVMNAPPPAVGPSTSPGAPPPPPPPPQPQPQPQPQQPLPDSAPPSHWCSLCSDEPSVGKCEGCGCGSCFAKPGRWPKAGAPLVYCAACAGDVHADGGCVRDVGNALRHAEAQRKGVAPPSGEAWACDACRKRDRATTAAALGAPAASSSAPIAALSASPPASSPSLRPLCGPESAVAAGVVSGACAPARTGVAADSTYQPAARRRPLVARTPTAPPASAACSALAAALYLEILQRSARAAVVATPREATSVPPVLQLPASSAAGSGSPPAGEAAATPAAAVPALHQPPQPADPASSPTSSSSSERGALSLSDLSAVLAVATAIARHATASGVAGPHAGNGGSVGAPTPAAVLSALTCSLSAPVLAALLAAPAVGMPGPPRQLLATSALSYGAPAAAASAAVPGSVPASVCLGTTSTSPGQHQHQRPAAASDAPVAPSVLGTAGPAGSSTCVAAAAAPAPTPASEQAAQRAALWSALSAPALASSAPRRLYAQALRVEAQLQRERPTPASQGLQHAPNPSLLWSAPTGLASDVLLASSVSQAQQMLLGGGSVGEAAAGAGADDPRSSGAPGSASAASVMAGGASSDSEDEEAAVLANGGYERLAGLGGRRGERERAGSSSELDLLRVGYSSSAAPSGSSLAPAHGYWASAPSTSGLVGAALLMASAPPSSLRDHIAGAMAARYGPGTFAAFQNLPLPSEGVSRRGGAGKAGALEGAAAAGGDAAVGGGGGDKGSRAKEHAGPSGVQGDGQPAAALAALDTLRRASLTRSVARAVQGSLSAAGGSPGLGLAPGAALKPATSAHRSVLTATLGATEAASALSWDDAEGIRLAAAAATGTAGAGAAGASSAGGARVGSSAVSPGTALFSGPSAASPPLGAAGAGFGPGSGSGGVTPAELSRLSELLSRLSDVTGSVSTRASAPPAPDSPAPLPPLVALESDLALIRALSTKVAASSSHQLAMVRRWVGAAQAALLHTAARATALGLTDTQAARAVPSAQAGTGTASATLSRSGEWDAVPSPSPAQRAHFAAAVADAVDASAKLGLLLPGDASGTGGSGWQATPSRLGGSVRNLGDSLFSALPGHGRTAGASGLGGHRPSGAPPMLIASLLPGVEEEEDEEMRRVSYQQNASGDGSDSGGKLPMGPPGLLSASVLGGPLMGEEEGGMGPGEGPGSGGGEEGGSGRLSVGLGLMAHGSPPLSPGGANGGGGGTGPAAVGDGRSAGASASLQPLMSLHSPQPPASTSPGHAHPRSHGPSALKRLRTHSFDVQSEPGASPAPPTGRGSLPGSAPRGDGGGSRGGPPPHSSGGTLSGEGAATGGGGMQPPAPTRMRALSLNSTDGSQGGSGGGVAGPIEPSSAGIDCQAAAPASGGSGSAQHAASQRLQLPGPLSDALTRLGLTPALLDRSTLASLLSRVGLSLEALLAVGGDPAATAQLLHSALAPPPPPQSYVPAGQLHASSAPTVSLDSARQYSLSPTPATMPLAHPSPAAIGVGSVAASSAAGAPAPSPHRAFFHLPVPSAQGGQAAPARAGAALPPSASSMSVDELFAAASAAAERALALTPLSNAEGSPMR